MNGIECVSVVWSSGEKEFESTCRYHKRFKCVVVKGTIVSSYLNLFNPIISLFGYINGTITCFFKEVVEDMCFISSHNCNWWQLWGKR